MHRWLGAVIVIIVVFALAFGATSVNVRSTSAAQTVLAAGLSPAERKAQSAALFMQMGHVIQSTRCLNCHPADRHPTQGDDMHIHNPPMIAGTAGHGLPGFTCHQCHGAKNFTTALPHIRSIPGNPKWALAPAEFAWQHKSLREICLQLKDPKRNGNRTLSQIHEHVSHDSLVGWSWHPGVGRKPSPGTQAAFGELTQRWIDSGAECPAS